MLSKYKLFCVAGLVSLMSCESLDQNPLKELGENTFWNTEAEVLFAVTGLYNGWENGSQIFYLDCVSDNSNNDFSHEGFQQLGNGTATPTNPGNAASRYTFSHIRRANWILENIDKAPISDDLKKRLVAEVRTIRAYRYLDLVTLFGDVPLITQTLTIPESYIEKTPKEKIYEFLENELKDAAADLPEIAPEKGRMTKGAALGFLARVYAFQNKHEDVVNTTEDIIGLDVYKLFDNYAGLFEEVNEGNSEVLSDVQYIENDFGYDLLGMMMPNSIGGWSSVVPLQSLVDSYEAIDGKPINESAVFNPAQPFQNRDPRLTATILYAGANYGGKIFNPIGDTSDHPTSADNASNSGYNYKKYIQNPSVYPNVWNVGVNIIVQRFAEILLLNAEAKIELNEIDNTVYENINLVRKRAGLPIVTNTTHPSQNDLRVLVRRELRVELAGEGRRRFDILRWGIADQVMNGPVYGSLSEGNIDPLTGIVTFTNLADRFFVENRTFVKGKNEYWPIPQSAIDASKNILIQNPNY